MIESISITPTIKIKAMLAGSWTRPRAWDWIGTIKCEEPIVALSLMQVGTRLDWVRSEKGPKNVLEARLLLAFDTPNKSNVCACFGIGEASLRRWTLLSNPNEPPKPPKSYSVPIGRVFPFCEAFGMPAIQLFGLVLLRSRAVGARAGLWHLKPEYRVGLTESWADILSCGRSGFIDLAAD